MKGECKKVIEEFSLHLNPDLTSEEKTACKQHLIECATCQAEYEKMLHTAAILESLPEAIPPAGLVEAIQTRIYQPRQHSVLNFFANPMARILVALKLGPHPTFVNYAAMLFYLMLTIFLVKLTFFNSPDSIPLATVKPPQAKLRIVQLGDVKQAALKYTRIEEEESKTVPIPMNK